MNCASKTRFFQFFKAVRCQNFGNGSLESISMFPKPREFLIFQRGYSTKLNLFDSTSGLRSLKTPRQRKKNVIGPYGYFLLSMPITAFCLGTWQIQRLRWKLAKIEDLNTRVSTPPVELPLDLSKLESMEYRPVKVRGRFLHDKEFTIGPKSLIVKGAGLSEGAGGVLTPGKSNSGLCVVTPFEVEGRDLTIMVNRGWVPHEYKKRRKQTEPRSDEVVEVTGVVRLSEKRPVFTPKNSPQSGFWLYRDLEAMSEAANTAPVYIELISSETVPGGPIAGQTRVTLRNEHVAYIFTWYSLSLITGWLWHRQFIRKLPLM